MDDISFTKVKITMPSKTLFEANATLVNIPGGKGMFGVMPGHMKLISKITIGLVTVFHKETTQFFIYGGIAQITQNKVNIVTEFAVNLKKENKGKITKEILRLENSLKHCKQDSLETHIIKDNIEKYKSLLTFL